MLSQKFQIRFGPGDHRIADLPIVISHAGGYYQIEVDQRGRLIVTGLMAGMPLQFTCLTSNSIRLTQPIEEEK